MPELKHQELQDSIFELLRYNGPLSFNQIVKYAYFAPGTSSHRSVDYVLRRMRKQGIIKTEGGGGRSVWSLA